MGFVQGEGRMSRKLSSLSGAHPILTDVFYVKTGTDPQTKEVKSVLVKRGKELHGPDKMYLYAQHIVLVEPVTPASQVTKLIEQSKVNRRHVSVLPSSLWRNSELCVCNLK